MLNVFMRPTERLASQIGSLFEAVPPRQALRSWAVACLLALIVVGAVLRFWGVGSYGLHKPDEDTTVLPAVHILQDGTPRFPSGMFYARAIVQSYMIAASVMAFGETEWAIRLPSVLCGVLVVGLAYWVGRRFLAPPWNLAFAACVALLPGMIADSQEGRMYIFMIASLVVYAGLVFEWERSGNRAFLIGAVVTMWVGIQFQQLVFFGSLVVLFPGVLHGDRRKLVSGVLALGAVVVGYVVIARVIGSFYPDAAPDFAGAAIPQLGRSPAVGWGRLPIGAAGALLGLALAWLMTRRMSPSGPVRLAGALVLLAFISEGVLYWHVATLLLLAAVILVRRHGPLPRFGLAALLGSSAVLVVLDVVMLRAAGVSSARKLAGMLVGEPSIWQYVRIVEYSPVAAAITFIGLGVAAWQVANRKRVPDYWLFFLLAVGLPLFGMGLFGWYFPPRYTEFALLPLLLVAFSVCQQAIAVLTSRMRGTASTTDTTAEAGAVGALAAVLACAAIVNPFAVARAVNAGHTFPDHRGAARFIRSAGLGPKDIVIAEEVLMQTYYLGHIDYWLQSPAFAASFVIRKNGQFVDEYTDTPVISTGAALRALLDRPDRGAIYVVGSGENQEDGRLELRGPEIAALLQSDRFQEVYVGPDRLTRVWRAPPPAGAP
jgi:4-amino-4-deoxy-L-arabinose transferase-like glycosyltransferase